jgi:hypothetical protein
VFGAELPGAQKWLVTLSVMLVTIMQILDTSVTKSSAGRCGRVQWSHA